MNISVKDGFYFECPYCGRTAMAGNGEDSEGNTVQVVTHVLPYCPGFERDDPIEFIAETKRRALARLAGGEPAATSPEIKIPHKSKPN